MTAFSTESFDFYFFDSNEPSHERIFISLERDQSVTDYMPVYSGFMNGVDDLNCVYVVSSKILGTNVMIGLLDLYYYDSRRPRFVDLHIAIEKQFRGVNGIKSGLGARIISEATDYLLENHPKVKLFEVMISPDNQASLRAFEKAGFRKYKNDNYRKSALTRPR